MRIGGRSKAPHRLRVRKAGHRGSKAIVADDITQSDEFQAALKEAVDAEVDGLKGKNKELIGKSRKFKRELDDMAAQFDGVDPERFHELATAAERAEKDRATKDGDWEVIREKLEAKHAKALEPLTSRNDMLESALRKHLVNDQLSAAIAGAGVLEEYRPAVLALLRSRGPAMSEEDGKFKAVIPDDVGDPISLPDFVTAWSKLDEAAAFMPKEGTGGGGSAGSKASSDKTQTIPGIEFLK